MRKRGMLTDSDHQQLSRADHVDYTICVLENLQHHRLLIFRGRSVLGMGTGVNNAVHVEVEIIELFAVGIGTGGVNRYYGAIFHCYGLVLNDWRDDFGVLGGKPPERGWDTHRDSCGSV